MLTESLKTSQDSEYIHVPHGSDTSVPYGSDSSVPYGSDSSVPYGSDSSVPFCSWESIYECIKNNGLLNIPIDILFHYNKSVVNEVVVAVSPVNTNTPIGVLLEGYNMQNVNLQDNNNDGLEDNNHFHFLSDTLHRKLMELLNQEGLLNKDVNILYKVNSHVNDVVKICYTENNSHHTLYTYNHNIRELAFIVSSSESVEEINQLLAMDPVNVFIRKLK